MLCIVDDLPAVRGEMRHRVFNNLEILLISDLKRSPYVKEPALAEDGHNRRLRFQQCPDVRIVLNPVLCPARAPKCGKSCVPECEQTRPPEEFDITWIRAGPAAFNIVDAEFVQRTHHVQFVVNREAYVFPLGSIPEGCIIQCDVIHCAPAFCECQ